MRRKPRFCTPSSGAPNFFKYNYTHTILEKHLRKFRREKHLRKGYQKEEEDTKKMRNRIIDWMQGASYFPKKIAEYTPIIVTLIAFIVGGFIDKL